MFKLSNVTKKYIIENHQEFYALKNVNLELPDVGLVGIIGRSGSGKTTLLNAIGGLDSLSEGYIEYNGKRLDNFSASDFCNYRSQTVAYIFQDYNLLPNETVLENVKLSLRFQSNDEKHIDEIALNALKETGIFEYAKRKVKKLSGGQKQRVAIARALARKASVILCDEPTGNLDAETATEIMDLLKKISSDRLVILVTHDHEIYNQYCDLGFTIVSGSVSESKKSSEQNNRLTAESALPEKHPKHLSLRNLFRYAFLNIHNNPICTALSALLLIIGFTLLITFFSLSHYNKTQAIQDTLTVNNDTIIPLARYTEDVQPYKIEGSNEVQYKCTFSMNGFASSEEDEKIILDQFGINTTVYKSYYYTTYLKNIIPNSRPLNTKFYSDYFQEFIVINNFDTVSLDLLAGKKPQSIDEVLIYDYMAMNLCMCNPSDELVKPEDLVGYHLCDSYCSVNMVVSGIIKSQYEKYKDIDSSEYLSKDTDFEQAYLAGLQCIIGFPEMLENIKKSNNLFPYSEATPIYVSKDLIEEPILGITIGKIQTVDNVDSFNFIGKYDPYELGQGVIISKKFAQKLIGTDDITESSIYQICYSYGIEFILTLPQSIDIEKHNRNIFSFGILGIYDNNDTDLFFMNKEDLMFKGTYNGSIKRYFISLDSSEERSKEIIEAGIQESKSEKFCIENKDWHSEGFMLYTPYLQLIDDADVFLKPLTLAGQKLEFLAYILIITGIIAYGLISIKRNKYTIGLYRSLGAEFFDICFIFCSEIILIMFITVIVSAITSNIVVNAINKDFVKDYPFYIVFFGVNAKDYIQTTLINLGISLAAMIVPLVKLIRTDTIRLIREGKNN